MRILPTYLVLFLGTLLMPQSVHPQRDYGRSATGVAGDVATLARDLSDKAQDARNAAINNRSTSGVDLYVALHGFAASAQAYAEMAKDSRDETTLRTVGAWLVSRAGEIDTVLNRSDARYAVTDWRLVQNQLRLLSDRLNLGYTRGLRSGRFRGVDRGVEVSGDYFRWRGRVDGADYINLQGSRVTVRHIEHGRITESSYDLPRALPRSAVTVQLRTLRGRGTVEIYRQPSAANNYTATVLIDDQAEGSDFYEFELTW